MAELLTVGEVAKILKLRRETIRRYVKDGHLKAATLPGGDYRFCEEDLQELLRQPSKKEGSQNGN